MNVHMQKTTVEMKNSNDNTVSTDKFNICIRKVDQSSGTRSFSTLNAHTSSVSKAVKNIISKFWHSEKFNCNRCSKILNIQQNHLTLKQKDQKQPRIKFIQ